MLNSIFKILSSSFVGAMFAFLVQIIVANKMTVNDYGVLSSSLALCAMLIPIVGLGFEQYIYKYSAENNAFLHPLIFPVLKYFFITALISVSLFFLLNSNKDSIFLVSLVLSQFFLNVILCICQIKKEYNKFSLISLLQGGVRLFCILFGVCILGFDSIFDVSGLYFFASLIVTLICIFLIVKSLLYNGSFESVRFKDLAMSSIPFGIGSLSHIIYSQSNIFLLEKFDTAINAGLYTAAYLFLMVSYLIPTIIFQRYLIPKLHVWMSDGDDLRNIYRTGNTIMLFLGVLASAFFIFLSDLLVAFVFGPGYSEAANVLSMLSTSIVLRYFSSNSAAYLLTKNYINVKNKMMLFTMVCNVVLSMFLIDKFGLYGAVYAAVISELIIALFYVVYVKIKIFKELSLFNMFARDAKDFIFLFKGDK